MEPVVGCSTFHIRANNYVYAYMSLGTVDHCLFTWTFGIPIHEDEPRAIGAFYARRHPHVNKGWENTMRARIKAHRVKYLKQGYGACWT